MRAGSRFSCSCMYYVDLCIGLVGYKINLKALNLFNVQKFPYSAGDIDVFCQNKCSHMLLGDMKNEYHFKIKVLIPEKKKKISV